MAHEDCPCDRELYSAAGSFTCHVSTCRKEYYRNFRASVRIVTRNSHTQAYGKDCNSFQEQGSHARVQAYRDCRALFRYSLFVDLRHGSENLCT